MKRVAVFVYGGVAPIWSTESVPALRGLIERLSGQFDVSAYATVGPDGYDRPFSCGNARVTFVRARQEDLLLRRVTESLRAFKRDHRRRPFALAHGFWALPGGMAAVAAGKLADIPSVISLLGGESACLPHIRYGSMTAFAPRAATLWTCRNADALTLLTEYQLLGLRRFGFNRRHGISIIPFGAEPALLEVARKRLTAPPYHFLHIGHLNRVKDQVTLLKAFQRIRGIVECHLRIIGEDTLQGSLQRCAEGLGIASDVTFAGLVAHERLRDHFSWSDLLIHTSLYEGEGVVFAEAAAAGVPICGTHVGLLADLGPSFSVTVPPGDYAALAREALHLVQDPPRMESLRTHARNWAIKHTADWTADQFTELFTRQIMNPTKRVRRYAAWRTADQFPESGAGQPAEQAVFGLIAAQKG